MARKTNWSKVRDKADAGETRDKTKGEDPATTPLGTDEEAGGSTTPPEEIARTVADDEPARRKQSPASRKPRVDETRAPASVVDALKRLSQRLFRR